MFPSLSTNALRPPPNRSKLCFTNSRPRFVPSFGFSRSCLYFFGIFSTIELNKETRGRALDRPNVSYYISAQTHSVNTTTVQSPERIYPIADEDLDRSTEEKTSSVHFLRFELSPDMITAAHGGEPITAGIDHPAYAIEGEPVEESVRQSLVNDLAETRVH